MLCTVCVCVAVDEEPEQEDIMAGDTSGSEARNETGMYMYSFLFVYDPLKRFSRAIETDLYSIYLTLADDDIEREADLQEEQIVS